MKKTLCALLAFLLVIGLFAGCGGSGEKEDPTAPASSSPSAAPAPGETDAGTEPAGRTAGPPKRYAHRRDPNDPATLNPCLAQDEGAGILIYQLFNNLVMMDVDYNIIPDLADSWEYNDDYTQLTFPSPSRASNGMTARPLPPTTSCSQ